MKLRYKIGLVVTVLGTMFLWGRCSRTGGPRAVPKVPTVLPTSDLEQIRVDPSNHTIVIQNRTSTKTETLPNRPSVIDVLKDGSVKVTAAQSGFEHGVF